MGIVGLKGSGKSEIARHLTLSRGFVRHRFAGPLKRMLQAGFGLTDDELDGDLKEVPCARLAGKTPRWAMQSLGTEWGRDCIAPDIWMQLWKATLPPIDVVADDVRFEQEAAAIHEMGGKLIAVHRPSLKEVSDRHRSETQVLAVDHTIVNGGTLTDLGAKVDQAISDLFPRPTS